MTTYYATLPPQEHRDQRQLVEAIRALRRAAKALDRGDVYDVLQNLCDASLARGLSNTWETPSHTRVIRATLRLREKIARRWAELVPRG